MSQRQLLNGGYRLHLCVLIISGYLCGGIAGAAAFRQLGNAMLFIPGSLAALTALVYAGYELRKRPA